jgi:hypothetical protein
VTLVDVPVLSSDAMNAKDHAKLEALMAPEFALYRWNGELAAPRPDWLNFLYNTEIKEYSVHDISAMASANLVL